MKVRVGDRRCRTPTASRRSSSCATRDRHRRTSRWRSTCATRRARSLYDNDVPGLDPSLTSLPAIARGAAARSGSNNQIPTATAAAPRRREGRRREGAGARRALPQIDISKLTYGRDVSGVFARGVVATARRSSSAASSSPCVARAARKVVAAGRAIVERLAARADPQAGHLPRLLHRRPEGRRAQLRRSADRPRRGSSS